MLLCPTPSVIEAFWFGHTYTLIHPLLGMNNFSKKKHACVKPTNQFAKIQEHAVFLYEIKIFVFENNSMEVPVWNFCIIWCYLYRYFQVSWCIKIEVWYRTKTSILRKCLDRNDGPERCFLPLQNSFTLDIKYYPISLH